MQPPEGDNPWDPSGPRGSDWSAEMAPALLDSAVHLDQYASDELKGGAKKTGPQKSNPIRAPIVPRLYRQGDLNICWAATLSSWLITREKPSEPDAYPQYKTDAILDKYRYKTDSQTGLTYLNTDLSIRPRFWGNILRDFNIPPFKRFGDSTTGNFADAFGLTSEWIKGQIESSNYLITCYFDPTWVDEQGNKIWKHAWIIYGIDTKYGDMYVADPNLGYVTKGIVSDATYWISADRVAGT